MQIYCIPCLYFYKTKQQKATMEKITPQYARVQKYYTSQLAKLYDLDFETMYQKLREFVPILGEKVKGEPWHPKEVSYIFYKLGTPLAKPLAKRGRKPLARNTRQINTDESAAA